MNLNAPVLGTLLAGGVAALDASAHLVGVLMAKGLGIDLRWVHYNSGGEASTALAVDTWIALLWR